MMHQTPDWSGDERRVNVDARVLEAVMREVDAHTALLNENHADHHAFIEELIIREKAKNKLHTAIIEKTVVGAVWAIIVALSYAVWGYIKIGVKS